MAPISDEHFPLQWFQNWNPFRLDALGLVTLLGADEVARAIGSLTRNALTDYLPVFGAFKVASDQIATVEPGFTLYNITDGITVTELAPWFTRWLNMHLEHRFSVLKWSAEPIARSFPRRSIFALSIGAIVNLGLLALACIQADWYGIANSCAMIMSVVTRASVCHRHRTPIDAVGKKASEIPAPKKKFLFVTPDGKVAIGFIPINFIGAMLDSSQDSPEWTELFRSLQTKFLPDPKSKTKAEREKAGLAAFPGFGLSPYLAKLKMWTLRALGWLAFGIQIVSIGQATLLTQICTVAVMTLASVATIYNIGVIEREQVGAWITIEQCQAYQFNVKGSRRTDAYTMLEPTAEEEKYMRERGLFPASWNQDFKATFESNKSIWGQVKSTCTPGIFLGLGASVPQATRQQYTRNVQFDAQTVAGAS